MFCPHCGQQQASDQMKFCSRCGFPLSLVSEVLSNGGFLPQLAALHDKKKFELTRRKVFKFALFWFLTFTLILIPIAGVIFGDTRLGERLVPLIAIIGTMGGVLMMLFSLFFKSAAHQNADFASQAPKQFVPQNQMSGAAFGAQTALPPQDANLTPANSVYAPPRGVWRDAQTGELIPPSVTEGTTRLLQKDE